MAAIGFFVALALGETVLPLRRGFAELGRMVFAAERIAPAPSGHAALAEQSFRMDEPLLRIKTPSLRLTINTAETLALKGPSGSGKTTLLMQIAGLEHNPDIRIFGAHPCAVNETVLRQHVTLLAQRSALIRGSVRDNLTLSGPAEDSELWAVLEAVALSDTIHERAGLEAMLDESGRGLSGGQMRRLTIARPCCAGRICCCWMSRPRGLTRRQPKRFSLASGTFYPVQRSSPRFIGGQTILYLIALSKSDATMVT